MAKYDLYVEGVPEEGTTGFRTLTRAFDRTIGVRGFQKLVLQWLKLFLTTKNSDPTNVEAGTDFPGLIGSNIATEADVRDVVLLSLDDCNEQIFEIQRTAQPDPDETLLSATLDRFEFNTTGDGFDAYVRIQNVAGDSVSVPIPIITEQV